VILLETLRDLPLHSIAHAFVTALLHTRQQQQSHHQLSCTRLQVNPRHTAVALKTLRNQTAASISQIVVTLHHTRLHVPLTPLTHNRTSHVQPQRHFPPPTLQPPSRTRPRLPS
jgi:hypothetical protein